MASVPNVMREEWIIISLQKEIYIGVMVVAVICNGVKGFVLSHPQLSNVVTEHFSWLVRSAGINTRL